MVLRAYSRGRFLTFVQSRIKHPAFCCACDQWGTCSDILKLTLRVRLNTTAVCSDHGRAKEPPDQFQLTDRFPTGYEAPRELHLAAAHVCLADVPLPLLLLRSASLLRKKLHMEVISLPYIINHLKTVGKRRLYILTRHVKYKSCHERTSALSGVLFARTFSVSTDKHIFYNLDKLLVSCCELSIVLGVSKTVIVTTLSNNVPVDRTTHTAFVRNPTWNLWQQRRPSPNL